MCRNLQKVFSNTAAFGRLCVETPTFSVFGRRLIQPPSGGCVLKQDQIEAAKTKSAAAFGRLCVETFSRWFFSHAFFSRLRAAVC